MPLNTEHATRKIFFSAGDLSGDIHSARLAREVLSRHPDWSISALGGAHLREAGAEIISDTSSLGVIGFASALAILPRSLQMRLEANRFLESSPPDAAVLCDWGGFNTRLLSELKRRGVPALYYFPPRSWQKQGAVGAELAELTSRVATPFEWSAERLNEAGGRADWVGHPLLEIVAEARQEYSRLATRAELGVTEGDLLIAILPGSRKMEIEYISPHVAGALETVQREYSGKVRFVVAVPAGYKPLVESYFPSIPIWEERTTEVLLASDAAIVKSGTITLEAAICDVPQIVVYDVPPLIGAQIRLTGFRKKVPLVAMPNIILGEMVAPELLGEACRAPQIAEALAKLIEDGACRENMLTAYEQVRQALGSQLPYTATQRTADILNEMLGS